MDANSFLMGGGTASAKFEHIGSSITGRIARAPEVRQQTDLTTGEPSTWPSGEPKMQLVIALQTDQRDPETPDDDGIRAVYVKGKSLTEAVRSAVKKAGAKGIEVGGTLTVTYVSDGEVTKRGFNPPKLYSATYAPPSAQAANEFLGVTQPPADPLAGLTDAQRQAILAASASQTSTPPF